ncbi:probable microsomal delta-5 desaturase [Thalassiosira pseudonana CCMP1335]|uniref:Probable microsomal delta-5 desaturase n=1 Tax=Thalassiosira pseudonana TaxID=35128 RepID=B8LCU4_THAPS|nr:probable microsomal delta-5 desaturase [Thalassiosira pseudonana CCMP1335]EED86851.1 probable microsomal delta-5 desaturase [Thalassiosira pseudonana CCMP1335]
MPPNAEVKNLRSRSIPTKKSSSSSSTANDDPATQSTSPVNRTLKSLNGNEIAIDGVIYDIDGFVHPGGEVISFFGGNDVTVQYKMIHPYHNSKHLEKMRAVGKIADYSTEYKFDTPFEREIKSEVFKIVRRGREFGTTGYFLRAFFYIALFFTMQYTFATCTTFTTYDHWYQSGVFIAIVFGISQAFIGLNVQHDANHGAASKRPWVNDLLGFGADLIGGCKWNWLAQHWTHHAYTNHADKDPDSFSSEPVFNFNDYPIGHPKRKWWHRFQGLYFLIMLSFYWVSMVFNPQVIDLRHAGAAYVGFQMENDFIVKRRKYAMALRAMYFYFNIYCPIVNNGLTWSTVGIILLMGVSESFMLSGLFVLSHNFENSERDPTSEYRKTGEQVCWFKSQVETSSTYGGIVAGCLTGGLNFQVEHHLFPRMSSAWYPFIAPKVREICKKHGVRYAYYPYIWQNLHSTVSYMHGTGTGARWELQPLSGRA